MEKCNFNYLYNEPNLNDIENFIIQLIKKYNIHFKNLQILNEKILLSYNKDEYITLIKTHKKIIIRIIKEVIGFFPQLSHIPHIVFIHGSFAKTLNRLNSDIDLNILYPNKFKNEVLPLEEIISIILQKVIGYSGRDKIHNMMIYTLDNINKDKIESTQDCHITFPDGQIYQYKCRPNYDEVMYKIKHSTRDYKDFTDYISNNINLGKCEEWCYSYETISTNCEDYDLYKMLKDNDEFNIQNIDKSIFNNLIMSFKNKINEYPLEIEHNATISNINYNWKVRNLGFIYKTLAIIRRYLFINGTIVNGLNFFEIFGNPVFTKLFSIEELKQIENIIFKYIWQLSRIEKVFSTNQINFSSRNYNKIEYRDICEIYDNLYNEDFKTVQNEVTNELYKSLNKALTRIHSRQEKTYE